MAGPHTNWTTMPPVGLPAVGEYMRKLTYADMIKLATAISEALSLYDVLITPDLVANALLKAAARAEFQPQPPSGPVPR
jgi:hypothetical protein